MISINRDNPITFIIVTWNNEKEIANCLTSIDLFSPIGSQVIVVDNNSTDNTVTIIKGRFPKVKLIESKNNLGFAAGNNLALAKVETNYICYLNPDTILLENIVTSAIDILEKRPDIGLVSCRLLNADGSLQPSFFNFADGNSLFAEILHIGRMMPQKICKKYFMNYYHASDDFFPDWVIGAEMIMRTTDAKTVGGFTTDYYMYTEDMDLCMKIKRQLQKKTYYMAKYSLIHLGGASESQNASYVKQEKLLLNDLTFIKKYFGDRCAEDARKKMMLAYFIRKILLYGLYWKSDRDYQIEKTRIASEIVSKLKKKE